MLSRALQWVREEIAHLTWKHGELIAFVLIILFAELLFSSVTHRQSDAASDAAEYSSMQLENGYNL